MPETSAAVTDTPALLYLAGGSARLGPRAAAHFAAADARRAIVYVPVAVMWEVTLLAGAARDLELPLLTRDGAIADSGAVRVWW